MHLRKCQHTSLLLDIVEASSLLFYNYNIIKNTFNILFAHYTIKKGIESQMRF